MIDLSPVIPWVEIKVLSFKDSFQIQTNNQSRSIKLTFVMSFVVTLLSGGNSRNYMLCSNIYFLKETCTKWMMSQITGNSTIAKYVAFFKSCYSFPAKFRSHSCELSTSNWLWEKRNNRGEYFNCLFLHHCVILGSKDRNGIGIFPMRVTDFYINYKYMINSPRKHVWFFVIISQRIMAICDKVIRGWLVQVQVTINGSHKWHINLTVSWPTYSKLQPHESDWFKQKFNIHLTSPTSHENKIYFTPHPGDVYFSIQSTYPIRIFRRGKKSKEKHKVTSTRNQLLWSFGCVQRYPRGEASYNKGYTAPWKEGNTFLLVVKPSSFKLVNAM